MLSNYDPNYTNSGRTAKQTVELTFQKWKYKTVKTTTVGGTGTGLGVIETAVDIIGQQLYEENPESEGELILKDEQGNTLHVELFEEDLEDMLVEARITDITPDNK